MRFVDSVVNLDRPSGITSFRSERTKGHKVEVIYVVYVGQVLYHHNHTSTNCWFSEVIAKTLLAVWWRYGQNVAYIHRLAQTSLSTSRLVNQIAPIN